MKLFLTYLFCALLFLQLTGQTGCPSPDATADFSPNNITTQLGHGGTIWWEKYGFRSVSGPQVNALYSGSLWIGGLDPGGNLKLSAETYGFGSGDSGFAAGPAIADTPDDPNLCAAFNRHWQVTRQEIEAFNADFEDNGLLDETHSAILEWPGRGNPQFAAIFGVALPDQSMAPFYDYDGDALYNPAAGDYPSIKGDEADWWMVHSNASSNEPPDGLSVGFEVRFMAYGYYSNDPVVANATFCEMTLINKGTEDLQNAYVGLFLDTDVGCPYDDYVGCIPGQRLGFAYNADATDGQAACNCDNSIPTYCDHIPVFAAQLLEDFGNNPDELPSLAAFAVISNPSVPSGNPVVMSDPTMPVGFYRLLQGLWPDGNPFTYGGSGYQTQGNPTPYLFHDLPSDSNGWSMCSIGRPPSDYRMLMSVGPHTFQPGSIRRITYALHMTEVDGYPCPDLDPLVDAAEHLQGFYEGTVLDNSTAA